MKLKRGKREKNILGNCLNIIYFSLFFYFIYCFPHIFSKKRKTFVGIIYMWDLGFSGNCRPELDLIGSTLMIVYVIKRLWEILVPKSLYFYVIWLIIVVIECLFNFHCAFFDFFLLFCPFLFIKWKTLCVTAKLIDWIINWAICCRPNQ